MGGFHNEIPDTLIPWIEQQRVFWVATAPLSPDGHVNVSPKGVEGTFHVADPHTVWYEDLSGSGIETISHIRENGRITILFNGLDGTPKIVRLFGQGSVHEFGTPEYDKLLPARIRKPGSRAVIKVIVHKVGTSCGWGVPRYTYDRERTMLHKFGINMEDSRGDPTSVFGKGLKNWWAQENTTSIDGLPGLLTAHESPCLLENGGFPKQQASPPPLEKAEELTTARRTVHGVDEKLVVGLLWGLLGGLLVSHVWN